MPELPSDDLRRLALQSLRSLQAAGVRSLPRPEPVKAAPLADAPRNDAPRNDGPVARRPVETESVESKSVETEPVSTAPPADKPPPVAARPIGGGAAADPLDPALRELAERSPAEALALLQQQAAGCTLCAELAASRRQIVFGSGNPRARVCFFGEAPGADEDRQGKPFVGEAGQLLTRIIEACTFSRDDVYILNTLKCRPPGNRNPEPQEIANCRPWFERQLAVVEPEYIVCLGRFAAHALLETSHSIARLRGRFHDWRGTKVLVTYHPAYLLRSPDAKRLVWEDMQLLMRDMGIEVRRGQRN